MNKHILVLLLALLVSSGAFAQNKEQIMPNSAQAEARVAENVKNGKEYHEGLLKVYMVEIDASSYNADDVHYIKKTSDLISTNLGYSEISHHSFKNDHGINVVRFTFSGMIFTEISEISKFITGLGFNVLNIKGELQSN